MEQDTGVGLKTVAATLADRIDAVDAVAGISCES